MSRRILTGLCLALCICLAACTHTPPSPKLKNSTAKAKRSNRTGKPKRFFLPPSPWPSADPLFPDSRNSNATAGDGLQWTVSGPSGYFAFPAGSYVQVPPRNWDDSPYQFAWDPETPLDKLPGAAWGTRMCLIVSAKPDFYPMNKCATWLQTNFYKVGITAGSVLEIGTYRNCVRGTAVIRGDTGAVEAGVMTWVSRERARRPYAELHVHGYGASDAIYPGDKVCFYVNASVCPTIQDLCGPDGSCAVSVWSGPGGKMIHQCSPSTSIPYPL